MLVAMAGLPGTGKTAIAELLGARLSKPVVSVDPIEAAILRAGIDADQPTGLAAYLVAEALAENVLRAGHGVIVDAVNAVDPAREQWVNLAARTGEKLKFVEVVCSDTDVHRARLGVPAVELGVRAVLLDHEHVDPQLEQAVQLGRGQVGEALLDDHDPSLPHGLRRSPRPPAPRCPNRCRTRTPRPRTAA